MKFFPGNNEPCRGATRRIRSQIYNIHKKSQLRKSSEKFIVINVIMCYYNFKAYFQKNNLRLSFVNSKIRKSMLLNHVLVKAGESDEPPAMRQGGDAADGSGDGTREKHYGGGRKGKI